MEQLKMCPMCGVRPLLSGNMKKSKSGKWVCMECRLREVGLPPDTGEILEHYAKNGGRRHG